MKSNRPTEPGIHWYRNNYDGGIDGTLIGRPYGRRSGPLKVFHLEDDGWSTMEHFERCEVAEWLGPAHPPKKVLRYCVDNVVGVSGEHQGKPMVFEEDVKEYILRERDEKEDERE